uniref:Uncharacterized protein n=2 Tax=Oryza sativa subsp. japonica TaxID=39947 RepID=Q7G7D1_ORYSJ|nr:hypothetical protein [Oryza sativa Japonica Group]AAP44739.1 hypothetical protein [Oryza sativa Japonica Group]ABG00006.1 hypothetical protein LOC_Os03g64160 [Oryza sativa Japonica Group]
MRVRFKGVGASPGFKESVSGAGWNGGAPRRAGDERRPPGADGNGSEAMPIDGGARKWFGEVLGSSRTVFARVVDELGPDDARNMAMAWMCWAAKAVDQTAEFSSRECGLARSGSESWQPCSELAAMRRQSMTVAEVELDSGNREESRDGFKVDSDIRGIGTSIWRRFKGGD